MPLFQVVVLAIVQGLTEFLPISSTAHLYLTSWLLGWPVQDLTFDIALHIGTLMAVLLYFYRDWIQIVAQGFGLRAGSDEELRQNRAMLWLLAIGSVPVGVFGLLFSEEAETTWRNPFLMGGMLIGVGILMALAERHGQGKRQMGSIGLWDTLVIGAAQAVAIVPGTSRSGVTIAAGLFRGIDRATAARFSFVLSTPAIAAAAGKAIFDLARQGGFGPGMAVPFVVGIVVSGITGWLVIAWLLNYLRRRTLYFFVYYRLVFGIMVLALAFIRRPG
jgi:undecaprenyl-diphosphatase